MMVERWIAKCLRSSWWLASDFFSARAESAFKGLVRWPAIPGVKSVYRAHGQFLLPQGCGRSLSGRVTDPSYSPGRLAWAEGLRAVGAENRPNFRSLRLTRRATRASTTSIDFSRAEDPSFDLLGSWLPAPLLDRAWN